MVEKGSVFYKEPNNAETPAPKVEVLTPAEMEKVPAKGERYNFHYTVPFFWGKNNLYIAAKIAERFRANPSKDYKVLNVGFSKDGGTVIIYTEIIGNTPAIIAIAAAITAIAIAITVVMSLGKVEKVITQPAGKALAVGIGGLGIAAAAVGAIFLMRYLKKA